MPKEITNCVARNVFDADAPERTEMLKSIISSAVFRDFLARQIVAAKESEASLSPFLLGKDDFYELAKSLRLISRLWADFLAFAEEQVEQADHQ